jgi:uncharacterized protein (TIGR02231 family)
MAPQAGALAPPVTAMADEDAAVRREMGALKAKKVDALAEAVRETRASVDTSGFQAVFGVQGRVSVLATGETKRVKLQEESIEPVLTIRAVPRQDLTAYLMAKLELPAAGAPLLPGQVALFRDGTFVGNGALPGLAPGEAHELGFGPDDQVKVKRIVTDNKKGESGILTTSSVEDRSFLIKVQNLHREPIAIQVLDRVPVSQQKDIQVDVTTKLTPTKKDFQDKRGTYSWEFGFGYRVTWPVDKRVQYRELTAEELARFGAMTK